MKKTNTQLPTRNTLDFSATRLPWHTSQWQHLTSAQNTLAVPQALLLRGAKGLGKLCFAKRLATELLCTSSEINARPCGRCDSCRWLAQDSSPDRVIIQPEEAGKSIKIDAIRAVIEKIHAKIQHGKHFIVIIEPAESLTLSAANALLKTLEEPLAGNIFLLISHQHSLVPATLRSRCQSLVFHTPSNAIAQAWLEQHTPKGSQLSELLALADNAPLRALTYAQTETLAQHTQLLNDLISLRNVSENPLKIAEKWQKTDPDTFIVGLMKTLMHLIQIQLIPTLENPLYRALNGLAQSIQTKNLLAYLDKLYEARRHILNQAHYNTALLVETFFIRFQQLT